MITEQMNQTFSEPTTTEASKIELEAYPNQTFPHSPHTQIVETMWSFELCQVHLEAHAQNTVPCDESIKLKVVS